MTNLDYLILKSKKFDLEAERLNDNTLKIYSKKYCFDNWLVVQEKGWLELWHSSKYGTRNKCYYHLQSTFKNKDKIKIFTTIRDHNEYASFYRRRNKVNLVDRVLGGAKSK